LSYKDTLFPVYFSAFAFSVFQGFQRCDFYLLEERQLRHIIHNLHFTFFCFRVSFHAGDGT